MSEHVKVSVIIPLKEDNAYIRETLEHLRRLDHPAFEILVFPDKPVDWGDDVRTIPTGHMGPASKRDLALEYATGDVLAFLDDDTYPVTAAVKYAHLSLPFMSPAGAGAEEGPGLFGQIDPLSRHRQSRS